MADSEPHSKNHRQIQVLQNYLDDLLFDTDSDLGADSGVEPGIDINVVNKTKPAVETEPLKKNPDNAHAGTNTESNTASNTKNYANQSAPEIPVSALPKRKPAKLISKAAAPAISQRIQVQSESLPKPTLRVKQEPKPEFKRNLRSELKQEPRPEPKPEPRVAPKLETKSQPRTSPRAFVSAEQELSVLEEQKRQRLQSMLSQPLAKKVLNSPLSRPTVVDKKALKQKTAESVTVVPVVKEAVVQSEQKAHADSESDPAARTSQNTDEKVSTFLKWQKNGRPVWAQREFEVLMFEVSGLTLAVPLVALGQIVPLTDKLAPVFGQSDWFMGLLPSKLGDIRVVNTALLVMPEKYDPAFTSEAGYVITIDGHPWGLAVDCVKQALKLEPDAVKWRGERSKRAWLAGTVKTEMCVLIDIPQMAIQLDGADKNLHSN